MLVALYLICTRCKNWKFILAFTLIISCFVLELMYRAKNNSNKAVQPTFPVAVLCRNNIHEGPPLTYASATYGECG